MVYYDSNGFHDFQNETNSRIPVTEGYRDNIFKELNNRTNEDNEKYYLEIKPDHQGYPSVVKTERPIEETKNILRRLRSNRVFPIINRSNLWYDSLTQEQKDELQIWYKKWLDVTETLVIPDRPIWLD